MIVTLANDAYAADEVALPTLALHALSGRQNTKRLVGGPSRSLAGNANLRAFCRDQMPRATKIEDLLWRERLLVRTKGRVA
jgi:hypothetical protein